MGLEDDGRLSVNYQLRKERPENNDRPSRGLLVKSRNSSSH